MFKKIFQIYLQENYFKKQSKTPTYWPQLDTEIHGWIGWSWSGNDIVNFIKAFGDPYLVHILLNNEKNIFKKL